MWKLLVEVMRGCYRMWLYSPGSIYIASARHLGALAVWDHLILIWWIKLIGCWLRLCKAHLLPIHLTLRYSPLMVLAQDWRLQALPHLVDTVFLLFSMEACRATAWLLTSYLLFPEGAVDVPSDELASLDARTPQILVRWFFVISLLSRRFQFQLFCSSYCCYRAGTQVWSLYSSITRSQVM